jgi:hypothetical protein
MLWSVVSLEGNRLEVANALDLRQRGIALGTGGQHEESIANDTYDVPAASLTSQAQLVCRPYGGIELYVPSHLSVLDPSRSGLVYPSHGNSLTRQSHTCSNHRRNQTLVARKKHCSRCDCSEKQGRLRSAFEETEVVHHMFRLGRFIGSQSSGSMIRCFGPS